MRNIDVISFSCDILSGFGMRVMLPSPVGALGYCSLTYPNLTDIVAEKNDAALYL